MRQLPDMPGEILINHVNASEMLTSTEQSQTPIGVITEVHGSVVVIACDLLPALRQALSANLEHESCR